MSYCETNFTILGYDLTSIYDEIMGGDWNTDKNKRKWTCEIVPGNIQLFYDPYYERHLYFGYIISKREFYDEEDTIIPIGELEDLRTDIVQGLVDSGLTSYMNGKISFVSLKIICFSEWS